MNREQPIADCYMDLKHLVQCSGLGRSTWKRLIASGQIAATCPTGKLLVKVSDYNTFMERHRVQTFDRVQAVVDDVMAEIRNGK